MTDTLAALIEREQNGLTERILRYARAAGYTEHSSTLAGAWQASVCGLSEPLLIALRELSALPEIDARTDHAREPISAFGREQARKHRERGVTLESFLGLLKYYRRAYQDLVRASALDARHDHEDRIVRFFDLMEIGLCAEWAGLERDGHIAELQRANRAIMDEKNKYLTVFESIGNPIVIVGPDGVLDGVNLAAQRLFGAAADPGDSYYRGRRPALLVQQIEALRALVAGPPEAEAALVTVTGTRRFAVKVQKLLDISEKFLGTVVILTDVTDYLDAIEQARAGERARRAFLATVNHELRTPLNGILGGARLLGSGGDATYARAIVASAEALLQLVDDILEYTRIEAGLVERETAEAVAGELVAEVCRLVAVRAAAKGLELRCTASTLGPLVVRTDPGKLRRILLCLLDNAVKFTEHGEIAVEAMLGATGPDRLAVLELRVADTGIGLPPGGLARLCEAFVQGERRDGREPSGAGLGLTIAERLTTLLGGTLDALDRAGGGTLVTLRVPVELVATEAVPSLPASRPGPVLVVDDDAVSRLVTGGMLTQLGHTVRSVASGEEALGLLSVAPPFAAVVLDLRLPGADGFAVARAIHALEPPERARVPLIALSAHLDPELHARALAAGFGAVLTKPADPEVLAQAIRRSGLAPARTTSGSEVEEVPLLDIRLLRAHRDALGEPALRGVVAALERTAAETLNRLDGADDPIARGSALHRLKGAAATLGLARLERHCGTLQRMLAEPGNEPIKARLEAVLRPSLDALRGALDAPPD
jgi:signal transduction histidine kinase/CheY-like chemotaxis protein